MAAEQIVIECTPVEPGARSPAQTLRFDVPRAEARAITIGRARDADVVLDGDTISRVGVRLIASPGELVLLDASDNGSSLNGRHGWGRRPVADGDVIRIGPYELVVRRVAVDGAR